MTTLEEKKQYIIDTVTSWNYMYTEVDDIDIEPIYQLFKNEEPVSDDELTANIASYYGTYYEIKENINNMIKYYKIAIQKGDKDACCNLALYYEKEGKIDLMMKYLRKGIKRDHKNSIYHLGYYYYQQKLYDNALKYFKKAARRGFDYAYGFIAEYYSTRDENLLLKYAKKGVKKKDLGCMIILGNHYAKKKDTEKMLTYYEMAVNNGYYQLVSFLGTYYSTLGDIDNMLKYYKLGVENGIVGAINLLSAYYIKNGEFEEAKQCLISGLETKNVNVTLNLADLCYLMGNIDDMVKYYMLSFDQGSFQGLDAIITYYKREKNYEKAIEYCEKGLDRDKKYYVKEINKLITDVPNYEYYLIKYQKYLNNINLTTFNNFKSSYLCYDKILKDYYFEKFECLICCEENENIELACKHNICYTCYRQVEKCPMCRDKFIDISSIFTVPNLFI